MTGHDDRRDDAARVDDLAVRAALGELSAAEAAELEAAAAADPQLRADLDADAEVVAELQQAAGIAPPPRLRDEVLAAVAATPQEPVRDDTVAPVTPLPRRRRGAAVLLAAAAAVALAVGAAVVILASPDGDDPVEAVVEAPDVVVRTLEGSLGGTLTSYTSAGADAVVLRGSDVPTVGPTQTYQAWSIDEGGAASLGLFRPDDEGNVEVRFDDVTDVTVIGITLEPAGGSAQPTPPILASA